MINFQLFADGESECRSGFKPCGRTSGAMPYCIHESLWCDNHVNCCSEDDLDERSCYDKGKL